MNKQNNTPIPQGKYVPANRYGNIIYSAGMTPRQNGVMQYAGQVQVAKPVEEYREAVILATRNALAAVNSLICAGESLDKALTLTVYVNAEHGYTKHAQIADFASDILCEVLGANGAVSRAAIGVASLPGNAPVEVQLVVAVK